MTETLYPPATSDIATQRKELAPGINDAFDNFSRAVFAEGALPEKTKQLIAVAVAHVTQCPYCITGHTKLARRKGGHPGGDHGGDLGRSEDARRGRLRALHPCPARDRPHIASRRRLIQAGNSLPKVPNERSLWPCVRARFDWRLTSVIRTGQPCERTGRGRGTGTGWHDR